MGVITWSPLNGGWLSGQHRKGRPSTGHRAARRPEHFDPATPHAAKKLDLIEQLLPVAEAAGCSLIELALAFVLAHPTVTAAIIGPRTMAQLASQISATDVCLSESVLDRIDDLVPPGTNVNAIEAGWTPPQITDKRLRRRTTRS